MSRIPKGVVQVRVPGEQALIWRGLRWLIPTLLLIALLLPTVASAAKRYHAERYDVDLAIQADGTLVVTETVVFRFEGGPFTYVFRELPYRELDEIVQLQASMDGDLLLQGTGPGQVEIRAGNPLKVIWHFSSTSDATHTFTLVYRVLGALRQLEGADALIWRAIPEDHDYEIAASTITLHYPDSVPLLGKPIVRGAAAGIEAGAGLAVIAAQDIKRDRDVVVEVRFPAGSLVRVAPRWQVAQAERDFQLRQAWPWGLAAGLLTAVVGGGLLASFWRRHPRPQPAPSDRLMMRTEPPTAHPPAVGIRLAGGAMPALATLFDLAQRGVLQIEEIPGRWGRKFAIHRQSAGEALRPHEQGLLEALFRTKDGMADNLDLGRAGRRLAGRRKQFNEPLEEEMVAAGLMDGQRRQQRQRLLVSTVVAMLVGMALLIAGLILAGASVSSRGWGTLPLAAAMVGLGAGLVLIGLVGVIQASLFSTLTAAGEEVAAAWRSFLGYLKEVARGRQALLRDELFEAYLPYAAGYGLAERWAKRYQKQSGIAVPAWFRALRADDSMGAFVAAVSASHGSFGSSGAGGGAGASGGGASGAG